MYIIERLLLGHPPEYIDTRPNMDLAVLACEPLCDPVHRNGATIRSRIDLLAKGEHVIVARNADGSKIRVSREF